MVEELVGIQEQTLNTFFSRGPQKTREHHHPSVLGSATSRSLAVDRLTSKLSPLDLKLSPPLFFLFKKGRIIASGM